MWINLLYSSNVWAIGGVVRNNPLRTHWRTNILRKSSKPGKRLQKILSLPKTCGTCIIELLAHNSKRDIWHRRKKEQNTTHREKEPNSEAKSWSIMFVHMWTNVNLWRSSQSKIHVFFSIPKVYHSVFQQIFLLYMGIGSLPTQINGINHSSKLN